VTSRCLRKKLEGAGFPFQVKALENGVDDRIHALHIDKANHGPGTATHFHETTLDDIRGAQFEPQIPGKAEEGQQLLQILFQLAHQGG
jgi:hypothetical protein